MLVFFLKNAHMGLYALSEVFRQDGSLNNITSRSFQCIYHAQIRYDAATFLYLNNSSYGD